MPPSLSVNPYAVSTTQFQHGLFVGFSLLICIGPARPLTSSDPLLSEGQGHGTQTRIPARVNVCACMCSCVCAHARMCACMCPALSLTPGLVLRVDHQSLTALSNLSMDVPFLPSFRTQEHVTRSPQLWCPAQ